MAKTPTLNFIGLALRYTVKEDGEPVDISPASETRLRCRKPSGLVVEFDAEFVTDGTDGQIEYVTAAAGDLDESGDWRVAAWIKTPSYEGYTLETVLRVK